MAEEARTLPPPVDIPVASKEASIYVASQWRLMWRKFRKHKPAMFSGVVTLLFYLVALFAEVLAPFNPGQSNPRYTYAPPQRLHFIDQAENGIRLWPHVFGYKVEIDRQALRRTFVIDPTVKHPVGFFVQGEPYKLWGLFEMRLKLIGPLEPDQSMYLLGADRLGRDVWSRIVHGTRISMSIGLVGVFLSFILGIILGGVSGYYGGAVDNLIQRLIEFIRAIPTIPLWLGLAAALPPNWPPLWIYFGITIILSFIGWTGLARVVRGRFLSLREEDFVLAARFDGCSQWRIIMRHMVPSFLSHIIASLTLAIPGVILAETALSFLGLGLRDPIVSWGVLLQEAQNIRSVATAPWLLLPGVVVIVVVLVLNFFGDGLRDAADPYAT